MTKYCTCDNMTVEDKTLCICEDVNGGFDEKTDCLVLLGLNSNQQPYTECPYLKEVVEPKPETARPFFLDYLTEPREHKPIDQETLYRCIEDMKHIAMKYNLKII